MISDELKEALGQRFDSTYSRQEILTMFIKNVEALLPRIVALERLLEDRQWIFHYDAVMMMDRWWCDKCKNERQQGHKPDCEIAKALEATHEP